MQDIILTVGGWIIALAVAVGGWVFRMIFSKLKDHEEINVNMDKKIDEHRLHVAENYAPKDYIEKMESRLISHLVRIEEKLDKKADK